MSNYLLLYNAFSILLGLASLVLFASLYWKYRKKLLKLYFIFLCVFSGLVLLSIGIEVFAAMYCGLSTSDINYFLHAVWYPFIFLFSFLFLHRLTSQKLPRRKVAIFIVLLCGFPFLAASAFFMKNSAVLILIASGLLILGIIVYLTAFTVKHYPQAQNEVIKRIIKLGALMMAIFLLGLLNEVHILPVSPDMKTLPTGLYFYLFYYFLWNIISIVLLISYFMGSLGLAVNMVNEVPEAIVKDFDITGREKEIIEMLVKGFSYQEIADRLFISYRTVKSHVYNIYQKLKIGNKIELVQLISQRQI